MGARGEMGVRGSEGSKSGVRGSEGSKRGVRGSEGSERERGEQDECYTRF